MPTYRRKIEARHVGGGRALTTGERNLDPSQNRESRNLRCFTEGGIGTPPGHIDPGWNWGESGHGIDGLGRAENYPDLLFAAVNGKVKYVDESISPQATATVYEADPGLDLTAGHPVLFREFRGNLYYANGEDDAGRIPIGKLNAELTTSPPTLTVSIKNDSYSWTISSQGTNVYFLRTIDSLNPDINQPSTVLQNGVAMTPGTLPNLAAGEWAYGNSDSLDYNTVYVRLSDSTDPDLKVLDYVQATFGAYLELQDSEGMRFNNATDKVYIEGDEVDYLFVSEGGDGDLLTGVTNVASTHAAGKYVTQKVSLTPPENAGSIKAKSLAFWASTLWLWGIKGEPNILRHSETISTVGTLENVNDFSQGNNMIVGDYGEGTALLATEKRLYVFTTKGIYYIYEVRDSDGTASFSAPELFTSNYGCANQFCAVLMENSILVFTGNRLIRIAYDSAGNIQQADDEFDLQVMPIFKDADVDQSNARLTYNPLTKEALLIYMANGVRTGVVYDNKPKVFTGPEDTDLSCSVIMDRNMYFGDPDDDIVYKDGVGYDAGDHTIARRYLSGRLSNNSPEQKFYLRGHLRGKKTRGSKLTYKTYIDGIEFGGARMITDAHMGPAGAAEDVGEGVPGETVVGSGGAPGDPLERFDYYFLLGKRGIDFSHSLYSNAEGVGWKLDAFEIEYVTNMKSASKHY